MNGANLSRGSGAAVVVGLAAAAAVACVASLAGCGSVAVDSDGKVNYSFSYGPVQVDGSRATRIVKCTEAGKCIDVGPGPTIPAGR